MTRLVAVDIGGTNARFALATIADDGAITLGEPVTLATSDHASLKTAWEHFARECEGDVPRAAAIALAGPVTGEVMRLTNNDWVIDTGAIERQLDIDKALVLNDFGAVAHAVARAPADRFAHLTGPQRPLPTSGTISIVGPGTGLGVAYVRLDGEGGYRVQATEGGHIDFAPVDRVDDQILKRLRAKHRRVSAERVAAGPGIEAIYETLAAIEQRQNGEGAIEQRATGPLDERAIWELALSGEDALAAAALDRFCMTLGSVAGDIALVHMADAVVIAGGLGYRLRDHLPRSGFAQRFTFKGRFEHLLAGIPVKLVTHPQPGLYGAAAAFDQAHGGGRGAARK